MKLNVFNLPGIDFCMCELEIQFYFFPINNFALYIILNSPSFTQQCKLCHMSRSHMYLGLFCICFCFLGLCISDLWVKITIVSHWLCVMHPSCRIFFVFLQKWLVLFKKMFYTPIQIQEASSTFSFYKRKKKSLAFWLKCYWLFVICENLTSW